MTKQERERPIVEQDPFEFATRPLLVVALVLIVAALLGVGGMFWIYRSEMARLDTDPSSPSSLQHPAVENTQLDVTARGLAQNRRARARLDHYSLIDSDAGIVQLPIDVAMNLALRRSREHHTPDAGSEAQPARQTDAGTIGSPAGSVDPGGGGLLRDGGTRP